MTVDLQIGKIDQFHMDSLWELHKLYKASIGEDIPDDECRRRLTDAVKNDAIAFYGAWVGVDLIGICSVTVGFTTFDYAPMGMFEDFFIIPEYRHIGAARKLVDFAYRESGVKSLTVGCADCDVGMYKALGFTVRIGNLLAYE